MRPSPSRNLLPLVALLVASAGLPFALAPLVAAPAPPARASRELTNSIGMKLVRLPPGKFLMGSPLTERLRLIDEGPQHEVEIAQSFYLGAFEVTQEQYEKVIGRNPSYFSPSGAGRDRVRGLDTGTFPVESVSWTEANDFCAALSSLPKELAARRTYRLPTEAEWEHGSRAGEPENKPFGLGNSLSSNQANFNGNTPYADGLRGPSLQRTQPVGWYKKANLWGLFDMHGNVQEWCADFYDANYYRNSPKQDPQGPEEGSVRVQRGGSYASPGANCRSAFRASGSLGQQANFIGFRVACDVAAK